MDVNPNTVIEVMRERQCLRLIHGHTHRPAVHDFTIDHQIAQRFVLAAWDKQRGEVLCWNSNGYQVEAL